MAGILSSPKSMGFLVIFGLFFNALLAFLNAHGMYVSTGHVMAMEMLTLAGIAMIAYPMRERAMLPWVFFSAAFVLIFLWVVMFNAFLGQSVSPKPIRDILIISAFGILGMCFQKKGGDIVGLIRIIAIAVVAVMLFENYIPEVYGRFFDAAAYYANTRGIEDTTLFGSQQTGLFVNTQLIEGRFSLGFLTSHRLGSLFLEQTTLGNFAIVMAIAASIFWNDLMVRDRIIFVGSSLLAVLGTDSRMALGMVLIIAGGHFIFPRLPRHSQLVYMPLILIVSYFIFYDPLNNWLYDDDLPGRFTWSLSQMSWIDVWGALGGRPEKIPQSMDSGYSYFIYQATLPGMVIFWFFTSIVLPENSERARRLTHVLSIFIAVNLFTGPTMLSIKIGAMLWFMVGYIYRSTYIISLEKQSSPSN